jgi:hypothetical protein
MAATAPAIAITHHFRTIIAAIHNYSVMPPVRRFWIGNLGEGKNQSNVFKKP